MADAAGNYDLKVEFLESNQFIDEEDEFRNFCLNLLEPGQIDPNAPTSTRHPSSAGSADVTIKKEGSSLNPISIPQINTIPASIKRVKPAFVQSLRPEFASVSDDDIRLNYAKLLFNAFNGLEKEDLGQKLRAICVEDCFMSVKWIGDKGNPCGPNYRDVTGLNTVLLWLEAIMVTAVPDAVVQLQDSKLRVRPDKSSYLLCKYTFNGTQISKIEPVGGPSGSKSDTTSTASATNNSTTNTTADAPNTTAEPSKDAPIAIEPDTKRTRTETGSKPSTTANTNTTNTTTTNTTTPKSRKRNAEAPPVSDNVDKGPYEATGLLETTHKMSIVGTLIIHINPEKRIFRFEYIQKLIRLVTGTQ